MPSEAECRSRAPILSTGVADLNAIIDGVQYPAVVKPSRSRFLTDDRWVAASVRYAHSKDELWRLYRDTEYLASYPSLIQERVVGPGVGVFLLFDHGEPVADFAHRRLREKPPSGGASVLCESAAVDPRLREFAVRLLQPISWHGVAMVEFKRDHRTGEPFLMEVNGRFWGSLQLAIDAGLDFPHLVSELAQGRTPDVATPYRIGVKNRWLLGDLDHLVLRLFQSDRRLDLPPAAPSKWHTLVEFLKFADAEAHYEVASGDDPRPFLYELRHWVTGLVAPAASPRRIYSAKPLRPSCSR